MNGIYYVEATLVTVVHTCLHHYLLNGDHVNASELCCIMLEMIYDFTQNSPKIHDNLRHTYTASIPRLHQEVRQQSKPYLLRYSLISAHTVVASPHTFIASR